MTRNWGNWERVLIMLSVIPSEMYSVSESALSLANGKTTKEVFFPGPRRRYNPNPDSKNSKIAASSRKSRLTKCIGLRKDLVFPGTLEIFLKAKVRSRAD